MLCSLKSVPQAVTIAFIFLIQSGHSLTLNEAFPWIDIYSPAIGQSLEEFEAQFPDAQSTAEKPLTEMAKSNQGFIVSSDLSQSQHVLFIDEEIARISTGIVEGDVEKITRRYRTELQKLYGQPALLETAQINREGALHPLVVEEYEVDKSQNLYAIFLSTSKGLHLRLFGKAEHIDNNRTLLPSIEDVRKSVERFGGSPDGEKTIVDFVAKLRAEEVGESTDDATSDSGGVVAEEDIASNTAPSESSPAPSAKKKFPTPLQIGGASAVIVLLVIVFAAKMRRPY